MKYLNINGTDLKTSQVILGCMRIGKLSINELEKLILMAVEKGINFFDHADIYGAGKSEEMFGEVLLRNPELREKIIIQTKCGIRKGFFDFSKEHIISSVEKSLNKLKTSYVDVLLLHRPDTLMELEEVKEAFLYLYNNKMVKYFGVSNFNPLQIELLQKSLPFKLHFNQLQLSIVHAPMIDSGLNVNMTNSLAINRDDSVLEYSRLKDITIQAWSVMQASWEEGTFIDNPKYQSLNIKLEELAKKYNTTKNGIALAWILRHPANIMPIIGTTSINHLDELIAASEIIITREEWYNLYTSVGKILP